MTWSDIWNNYINLEPGILTLCLRLLCAMAAGTLIGIEREYTHRPAGLRTHILVALGACVISITGEMLFHHYSALGSTADPARLSAQVISGVGFLGAGTIMKEGANVKGLTTAASVWAVACLGIAAGYGYYTLTILGTGLILITLTLFEMLQQNLLRTGSAEQYYILDSLDISASLALISATAQEQRGTIYDLMATQTEHGHRITFRIWYSGRHIKAHQQQFFDTLAAAPESQSLHHGTKSGTAV